MSKFAQDYEALRVAGETLNTRSDAFNRDMATIEAALEHLNLGVSAYVPLPGAEGVKFGYDRTPGATPWGFTFKKLDGTVIALRDAKRELRIAAAEYVSDLMGVLLIVANTRARELVEARAKLATILDSEVVREIAGTTLPGKSGKR